MESQQKPGSPETIDGERRRTGDWRDEAGGDGEDNTSNFLFLEASPEVSCNSQPLAFVTRRLAPVCVKMCVWCTRTYFEDNYFTPLLTRASIAFFMRLLTRVFANLTSQNLTPLRVSWLLVCMAYLDGVRRFFADGFFPAFSGFGSVHISY